MQINQRQNNWDKFDNQHVISCNVSGRFNYNLMWKNCFEVLDSLL